MYVMKELPPVSFRPELMRDLAWVLDYAFETGAGDAEYEQDDYGDPVKEHESPEHNIKAAAVRLICEVMSQLPAEELEEVVASLAGHRVAVSLGNPWH